MKFSLEFKTLFFFLPLLAIESPTFANPSQGRILFLDLNIASEEVHEVQKLAPQIGEVTVLPKIAENDRRRLNQLLRTTIPKLSQAKEACITRNGGDKTAPACAPIAKEIEKLETEKKALQKKYRFTPKDFKEAVAQFEAQGIRFDTLIVSGHDGTGDMYGDIGVLPMNGFKEVMDAHPSFRKDIQTLALWGCYTTAPPKLGQQHSIWEPIIPEVKLILGYNPQSPKSAASTNLSTLRGLLLRRNELIAERNLSNFGAEIASVPGIHPHFAAFQTTCDFYATPRSAKEIEDGIRGLCSNATKNYQSHAKVFQCYYQAQEETSKFTAGKWGTLGCKDVPEKEGSSALRDAYNFLQDTEQCSEYIPSLKPYRTSITKTIRLIFFKNVLANFEKYYGDQVRDLKTLLSQTGAPTGLEVPNFKDRKTKRSELLQFLTQVGQHIDDFSTRAASTQDERKLERLTEIKRNMSEKLYELNCVPFGWVEPDSIEEPDPRCSIDR